MRNRPLPTAYLSFPLCTFSIHSYFFGSCNFSCNFSLGSLNLLNFTVFLF
jgi:hypothetical protein